MDSITQAVLGAATAHACWHRQKGRAALAWGAALGTLPDLDIVAYPFLDHVRQLYWHRGESHSILFALLGGLIFGWLLRKYRWKDRTSFRTSSRMTAFRAAAGVVLVFSTHIALDYCTIYGTQLLAPFSRYGFGRGNLFIIDPLYTLPMAAGVLIAAVSGPKTAWRANRAGLVLSCLYLGFSLIAHTYADRNFKQNLQARGIRVLDSITGATPMNTLLWRHVARTEGGLLIGYFSIIGNRPGEEIAFTRVRQNAGLLAPHMDQRNVRAVDWFSKGFWVVNRVSGRLILSDLRFGEIRFSENEPQDQWQYIFSWEITDDPVSLPRQPVRMRDPGAVLNSLWRMITGRRP